MNEVIRWVLGVLFTLILGAYGYTWSAGAKAASDNEALENRVTRQLDIIERKIDRVIDYQYNQGRRLQ